MDIQKMFDQANEFGVTAVAAAIEELKQTVSQAKEAANAARQAYFSDVRGREAKVNERLASLSQQADEIKRRISEMQPGLVTATISGNSVMFDQIQEKLADLEGQKAAIATQIQLLSSATISGSLELYQAAERQYDAYEKAKSQASDERRKIHDFVYEQYKAWERLNESLCYGHFDARQYKPHDFSAVATHFNEHRPTGSQS